ncbi:hypothetical protein OOK31_00030 [Streptomyces sp. NBC_00249]|uniref:hypothetical protein n=1 Tax=Streptomyces sp. NBC_00249 TaxID=2975690 RepID=UPI00224F1B2E|nr:hypothetical protein [Streptomyces sp. NBC_00249]MCX5192296.1 hypothetical protein [Streptomyces sp. NBC_00249]
MERFTYWVQAAESLPGLAALRAGVAYERADSVNEANGLIDHSFNRDRGPKRFLTEDITRVEPQEVVEIEARPVIVEEAPRPVIVREVDFDRDLVVAERVEQDELVEALVSDFLGDDDGELIRVDNEND